METLQTTLQLLAEAGYNSAFRSSVGNIIVNHIVADERILHFVESIYKNTPGLLFATNLSLIYLYPGKEILFDVKKITYPEISSIKAFNGPEETVVASFTGQSQHIEILSRDKSALRNLVSICKNFVSDKKFSLARKLRP